MRFILSAAGERGFRKWLNTIFNKVDFQRIEDVGADRAAAEWLLRCGASVKWQYKKEWISDYNSLPYEDGHHYVIEEIDATDSCIMNVGFHYLNGLKYLKRIKFCKCIYIEDTCLHQLSVIKASLHDLEVISCGNISDSGVLSISKLENLKKVYLFDLPEVKNRQECINILQKCLPHCKIVFPEVTLN